MQPNDPNQPQQPSVQPSQPPQPEQYQQPQQVQPQAQYQPPQPAQAPVYAAPQPQPAAPGAAVYQSNPFLVCISGLVNILQVNPIASLLVGLMSLLFIVGVALVGGILSGIIPVVGILLSLIGFLVVFSLSIGATIALADRSIKQEKVSTSELFSDASKKLFPLIGSYIVVGLIVGLGSILLIVPGLIFAAWFSLTQIIMLHENLGVFAAMKRSRELTKGHIWEMLGAVLASMLLTGSGGLLSIPGAVAPLSGRYNQLLALKASGQPKPSTHWANYLLVILGALLLVAYFGIFAFSISQGVKQNAQTNSDFTSQQYTTPGGSYDSFSQ